MEIDDFDYSLPPDLIAQYPASARSGARLLALDGASGALVDARFADLPRFLRQGDLLVLNDTRVIPARLYGCKASGGRIEILIERITGADTVLAHLRASRPPRPGTVLDVDGGGALRVTGRQGSLFELCAQEPLADLLERCGHVPLPPYIERADEREDRERYQTVYARRPGAVAAPTAGLHFDAELFSVLEAMGVRRCFLTLHVGAGTFQPVRTPRLRDHRMHAEWLSVGEDVVQEIAAARDRGARVVAVGTTSVRALETLANRRGALAPYEGETQLFIYPGYRFRVVDAMVTNFHLPRSTLLMLVSAFAGRENVLAAYRQAVARRYRFYSYGDAMFITPSPQARP